MRQEDRAAHHAAVSLESAIAAVAFVHLEAMRELMLCFVNTTQACKGALTHT